MFLNFNFNCWHIYMLAASPLELGICRSSVDVRPTALNVHCTQQRQHGPVHRYDRPRTQSYNNKYKNMPARKTLVQLLALYTNPESHNAQRHRQTDGETDRWQSCRICPFPRNFYYVFVEFCGIRHWTVITEQTQHILVGFRLSQIINYSM